MFQKLYKNAPDLLLSLCLGLIVELANFENTFFKFMSSYRPEWGGMNHIFALLLSVFFLLNIVQWGVRNKNELSWSFAVLASVISFFVYSRMELSWDMSEFTEVHLVVLILSLVLPGVVAFITHQIAKVLAKEEKQIETPTLPPLTNNQTSQPEFDEKKYMDHLMEDFTKKYIEAIPQKLIDKNDGTDIDVGTINKEKAKDLVLETKSNTPFSQMFKRVNSEKKYNEKESKKPL